MPGPQYFLLLAAIRQSEVVRILLLSNNSIPIGSLYGIIYLHFVNFYGFHVGKSTTPMDPSRDIKNPWHLFFCDSRSLLLETSRFKLKWFEWRWRNELWMLRRTIGSHLQGMVVERRGFQHQLPDMLGDVKKRLVCEIFVIWIIFLVIHYYSIWLYINTRPRPIWSCIDCIVS